MILGRDGKPLEFQPVTFKSQPVPHLRRHITKDDRFLFDFTKANIRHKKRYTAVRDTKSGMVEKAKAACEQFYITCDQNTNTLPLTITVNALWERFKGKKQWSKVHRRNLEGQYDNHIAPIIGTMRVKQVTPNDRDSIMISVAHLSKSSRKRIFEILVPIFKLAERSYIIDRSPLQEEHRVARKSVEENKPVHNAKAKYKRLHKAIHKLFKDDPKMRAAFLFGFYGRRLNEVLTLKWSDIALDDASYAIRAEVSKVNAGMVFTLPGDLLDTLTTLHPLRDSLWVFSSPVNPANHMSRLSMHYDDIREGAGMPEYHYHLMRNIMVSALAGVVNTADLSAMLGHTDTATLTKYLTLQREEASEKVSNASKKLLR